MEQLIRQLERDEGIELKPYRDTVGKLTIGIGRNLDDVGISMSEARILLANDIRRTAQDLERELPWVLSLDEARRGVLLNMAFNMGIKGLAAFRRTLALVQMGKYADAADEMLDSKWAKQVGNRAIRLAAQMETGVWQ